MAKKTTPRVDVNVGDYVLIGRSGVTMPLDWFTAVVLWVGYGEVLTHHATPTTTEGFRQVFPFDSIIAVGTLGDLIDYREHCWRAVEDQERAVRACEADLGKARHAVWKVLDQLRVKAAESLESAT